MHKMFMLRSHGVQVGWDGVEMLTFPRPPSLDHAQDVDATLTWGGVGWDGVGMLTFPRPRSLDLSQDVDATLTWGSGGVGWGGDVKVPSATFPRPCTRCLCYAHMGWGGVGWGGVGMLTFPPPRSLELAQDVDAALTWGGVGGVGGC